MVSVNERLKRLRLLTRPRLSIQDVADALGMTKSAYYFYESSRGFKQPVLPLHLAKRVASVFADHGVDQQQILALAGAEYSQPSGLSRGEEAWLSVWRAMAQGQRRVMLQLAYELLDWEKAEGEPDLAPALAAAQ